MKTDVDGRATVGRGRQVMTEEFVDGFFQVSRAWYAESALDTENGVSRHKVLDCFQVGRYGADGGGGCDGVDGEMTINVIELDHKPVALIESFSPRLLLRFAPLWSLMIDRNASTANGVRDCLIELGFVDLTPTERKK